jgi:hypothetical protein
MVIEVLEIFEVSVIDKLNEKEIISHLLLQYFSKNYLSYFIKKVSRTPTLLLILLLII